MIRATTRRAAFSRAGGFAAAGAGTALASCGPLSTQGAAPGAAGVAGPKITLDVTSSYKGPTQAELYAGWDAGVANVLPNVKVNWILAGEGENIEVKTAAMLAAGTPPHYTVAGFPELALRNQVVDLDPYFKKANVGSWKWSPTCWDYVNVALDAGRRMLWAFPGNPDALMLWTNLDVLEKAAIPSRPTPIWDWPTFREAVTKLTIRREDGSLGQAGWSVFPWYGEMLVLVMAAGGHLFSFDQKTGWVSGATFSSPPALQGIELYHQVVVQDRATQLDPTQAGAPAPPNIAFQNGNVAMATSWMGLQQRLRGVTFKWDFLPYPVLKAGDRWPYQFANGSQMGAILKDAKYHDESFQLGKYLVSDGHVVRMRVNGAMPIVLNSPEQQAAWKNLVPGKRIELYDQVIAAEPAKRVPWLKLKANKEKIQDPIGKLLRDELLSGKISPRDFATQVDTLVNPLIKAGL